VDSEPSPETAGSKSSTKSRQPLLTMSSS
jgi:hypothetical protein